MPTLQQANFIRNFLSLFALFYTLQLVPTSVTTLLHVHLVFTLLLLRQPQPQYGLATMHYLTGFAMLVFYTHTTRQKSVNILLSMFPYGFYEMVLSHV